jgi:hypothetical protein
LVPELNFEERTGVGERHRKGHLCQKEWYFHVHKKHKTADVGRMRIMEVQGLSRGQELDHEKP